MRVDLVNSADRKGFEVEDEEGNSSFFEYKPPIENIWKIDSFHMILLYNPDRVKETDISELYLESNDGERVGWIFPLSVYSSERDSDEYNGNVLTYMVAAYQLLLQKITKLKNIQPESQIEDYYNEDIIVMLLHKGSIPKDFLIERYLPSLYNKGYTLAFKVHAGETVTMPISRCDISSGLSRVAIKKIDDYWDLHPYMYGVFKNELSYTANPLHRFILLYQIIEVLIEEKSHLLIKEHAEAYNKNLLLTNDFAEKIREATNERKLVRKVFDETHINTDLNKDFTRETLALFEKVHYECDKKDSMPDVLYSLRNQIFHAYRIFSDVKDDLEPVIQLFERVIIELIINYKKDIRE